jgi:hypothetical protein
MVGRVTLALVAASTADHDACLDRRAYDAQVGLGLPGHDSAHRIADIGAVEVEPDAPNQLRHARLPEAGVGAARAGGGTAEALVDTTKDEIAVEADRPWMPLDDVSNRHIVLLCVVFVRAGFRRRQWAGMVSRGTRRRAPRFLSARGLARSRVIASGERFATGAD